MQSQLFRKKNVERISSPEHLQDYMRVTNPGIWMVLAAVIVLLAGLLIASTLVKVETTLPAKGEVSEAGSALVIQLPPQKGRDVRDGMPVRLAGQCGQVDFVYEKDDTIMITASLDDASEPLPAGIYDVAIVTEALSPISFLLN